MNQGLDPSSKDDKRHLHDSTDSKKDKPTMSVVPIGFMSQSRPSETLVISRNHAPVSAGSISTVHTLVSGPTSRLIALATQRARSMATLLSKTDPTHLQRPGEEISDRESEGIRAAPSGSTSARDLLSAERRRHTSEKCEALPLRPGLRPPYSVDKAAEEEQMRSRRNHRKAIARIVVDHWKWFARDRLKVWCQWC